MQPYVHNYTEFRVHMCVIAVREDYIYLSINWSSEPGSGCKTNCMETILIFQLFMYTVSSLNFHVTKRWETFRVTVLARAGTKTDAARLYRWLPENSTVSIHSPNKFIGKQKLYFQIKLTLTTICVLRLYIFY